MSKKSPLIIGNWKLNPKTIKAAETLAADTKKAIKKTNVAVGIAPTFVHLPPVCKKLGKSAIALVAQDVAMEPIGAFTGEVSAGQLKDTGVSHVIVGHSERRAAGETDAIVVKKVEQVLKEKLTPVVCIGEGKRDSHGNFYNFVAAQVNALATALPSAAMKKVVIAYEPVWAIGTGKTASVDDVKEMQLFIYRTVAKAYDRKVADKICLLYGGSVKPHNAAQLHKEGGMNGFLVGGASLKAKDFAAIVKAVE